MTVSDFKAERAKRVTKNSEWSPEEAITEALREVQDGERSPTSVLVLFLEEDDNDFQTGWVAANLHSSKMIALMEMVKAGLLRDMGLT